MQILSVMEKVYSFPSVPNETEERIFNFIVGNNVNCGRYGTVYTPLITVIFVKFANIITNIASKLSEE